MTEGVNTTDMMRLLERIDTLEGEKKEIANDIKDLWTEAKLKGYTKELRKAYAIRKMKVEDRRVLGVYVEALGLFD
jgi:uncharacterized protein (UPF0335 family)